METTITRPACPECGHAMHRDGVRWRGRGGNRHQSQRWLCAKCGRIISRPKPDDQSTRTEGTERNLDDNTVDQLAQDFIGASIEKPEPGEIIDRAQLAEQLRAAGDDITDADVEAVAGSIEFQSLSAIARIGKIFAEFNRLRGQ